MEQENNNFNKKNLNSENNTETKNDINQVFDNQINDEQATNPKRKSKIQIIILIVLLIGISYTGYYIINNTNNTIQPENKPENNSNISYRISDNAINDFDLQFLKLENENKNKIYSPLSIKYALEMLGEGANGNTKKQITDIKGSKSHAANKANDQFASRK